MSANFANKDIGLSYSFAKEMAIMSVRYSIGGGTIATAGIIDDVIKNFPCDESLYTVLLDDYRRWREDREINMRHWPDREWKDLAENWRVAEAFMRAYLDDTAKVYHVTLKEKGRVTFEDTFPAFKFGDKFIPMCQYKRWPYVSVHVADDAEMVEQKGVSAREWMDNMAEHFNPNVAEDLHDARKKGTRRKREK